MNDTATPIETLFEKVQDYNKTTIELIKLTVIDKSADVASSILSGLAIFMVVALSVMIMNIGIALWIGKLLGNAFYGFLLIGGFYAIIAILLHGFRHQLIKYPISNSIIAKLLKQKAA